MPGSEKTKISSRTDTAIADYFAQDIAETMQQIYRLGNPNFVILVPTNEGLADGLGIWNYDESQPVEVREVLMDETVTLLCPIVDKIQALSGLPIEVKRWDRYIGENFDQNKVTMQGIKLSEYLAETVPEYKSRLLEQAMSITGLDLNEIDSELLKEILQAQIRFNGVYLGEGNLSSGNVIGDRKVMWVNCEGAGVKEAQLLGANGDIAIVTPVKQSRIQEYYEWKRDVINGRG
ncbi:MAG: hypothetical protein US52_C0057G0008 [candidate division WS6 bacterium GW2011_GWA2_37_6]|uniref:Uncharacterized protein n=1 Tax=candidate division WS6 bacterium GW2011_GWA2_37_6 TaxID=1619087 RepID=A0A0G0GWN3_9BACT|nr:MAG: hypothetical protein US52_C0057G0008 [candidate division WS6 bacterium GW2011_GWA2_37_6]